MPIIFVHSIRARSLILYIGFCLLICYLIDDNTEMPFVAWWFIITNIVLFFAFGKDKLAAKMKWRRTPESTFLAMGLLGAFPAILIGRKIFKHKTTKKEFIIPMWILFTFQIISAIYYMEQTMVKAALL